MNRPQPLQAVGSTVPTTTPLPRASERVVRLPLPARSVSAKAVVSDEPQVNLGYVKALIDYAGRQGCPPQALAIGPELRARLRDPSPFSGCGLNEWHALLGSAQTALADDDLSLKLVQHLQLWHVGLVGYLLMTCTTLSEVGNVLRRFQHLLVSGYRVATYAGDTHFRMQLLASGGPSRDRVALLLLGSWAVQARWLSGHNNLRFDATFELPSPPNAAGWARLFGGKLLWGQQETTLLGPVSALALPMIHQSPDVNNILRTQAISQLERLTQSSSSFLAHVERYVKDRLCAGRVTLDAVASQMGCAPRTLQLRLEDYGITFRALLDGVRRSQARHHLRDSRLNLTEIALMLGFADQAAFSHAFKRWVGVSPGEWRRRLDAEAQDPQPAADAV